ncbi:MAG: hypothetical protein A2651_04070 [Candidatus Yanofskybacteria bacterium RIFCSPHIGHO2_01_FULL_42_12]|uniref:HTH arsR-type domain-containing protein n=1 Tax=Candidatus Yanofskybacteria bacterium RIFCSPLOWO2_01_FULL_42_49 TaxID=1802694 RepID=A0A1F8GAV2_9BACT|nr:MAG: hypothetical protein A2651_04070 [Candidatus Yanofskybacteria bacterium RIFCSPHIGHO2_01_FULL_42_12]OGN22505.1 MAG: hypothetical protein A2918_01960 [Candidatus Yanofskybacteria bacterium RIFCSPLOWO2_01_FULL_42_49]
MSKAESKHILDKLFGSRIRVKLLKFMFRNYPGNLGVRELSRRIQEPLDGLKKELGLLAELGLVKKNKI